MLLTSGAYFLFLLFVFFSYWLIAQRVNWRLVFLTAMGYFFYAQSGWRSIALLFFVSLSDYFISRLIAKNEDKAKRKSLLWLSLFVDIGILAGFKYANFFLSSVTDSINLLGFPTKALHLNIVVPMGISFFIFQSLAYVIDVYRRDTKPADNFLVYLSYLAFFPTLIAGPILRAKQFFPQLTGNAIKLTTDMGGQALFFIMLGLVKKIAIADYLSANLVDRVFDFPERFSSFEVLIAIYGYALQIYADFSGYSDIAIGSALLLGFTVPQNFNAPYLSRDLPEFWRRWHITLSNWLRDYLFFTIAGPRARNIKILYVASIITMLVGGLWHGPTWNFVIWGLLHGVGLVIVRMYENLKKRWKFIPRNRVTDIFAWILTFHFICFTWLFFRAETFIEAVNMLKQLSKLSFDYSNLAAPVIGIMMLGYAAHSLPEKVFSKVERIYVSLPSFAQAAILCVLAMGLYYVASSDVVPFIYAQF